MEDWVRLCGADEAPEVGKVAEVEAGGVVYCVANVEGRLAVMENDCPHRGAPLGEGTLEGEAVVCPWHAWCFSTVTGVAEPPERAQVRVFPVKVEGGEVLVQVG